MSTPSLVFSNALSLSLAVFPLSCSLPTMFASVFKPCHALSWYHWINIFCKELFSFQRLHLCETWKVLWHRTQNCISNLQFLNYQRPGPSILLHFRSTPIREKTDHLPSVIKLFFCFEILLPFKWYNTWMAYFSLPMLPLSLSLIHSLSVSISPLFALSPSMFYQSSFRSILWWFDVWLSLITINWLKSQRCFSYGLLTIFM